jgi:serine/threonine-protein kinase RsbW
MSVAGPNRHNPHPRAARNGAGSARAKASSRNGTSSRPRTLVFTIPSDLAASREVHKLIMDRVEACRYDEQSTFAIRLALEEGLMNAIKHGNKLDPGKTVYVEAKVSPKATEILIEDQGKGFDRTGVPDPCAEENLLKCSGRGILLMEAYMDKVEYSRGGRRVRMVKKNV